MNFTPIASSSMGNCYMVSDGQTTVLIDCGLKISVIKKALGFKVASTVDGVLISHQHGDHAKSLGALIKMGVEAYATKETATAVGIQNSHRFNEVKHKRQFKINTLFVLPFDVYHDVPNVGFLIYSSVTRKKLLFATDTPYIKPRFDGLTDIAIECNYQMDILRKNVKDGIVDLSQKKRVIRNHFELENVLEFFRANDLSKVERIYLMHLSSANTNEDEILRKVQAATGKWVCVCGE